MKLEDKVVISDFAWFMMIQEGIVCDTFAKLIDLIKRYPTEMCSKRWYEETYNHSWEYNNHEYNYI